MAYQIRPETSAVSCCRGLSNSGANRGFFGRRLAPLAFSLAAVGCGGTATSTLGSGGSDGGANAEEPTSGGTAGAKGDVMVKQVTAGRAISCALLSDGTAKCWGYNSDGQLGIDNGGCPGACTALWSTSPVLVRGLSDAVRIDAGYATVCAVLADGTASCWGSDDGGQLGDGMTTDSASPVAVQGLVNVASIAARASCAVTNDGLLSCWGGANLTPVIVPELSAVESVTGGLHRCVLLGEGTVRCWGTNDHGQLGDGTTVDSSTPVAVQGLSAVVQITGSGAHSCALLDDGTAKCWGWNGYGQLGDGTTVDSSAPVAVPGLSNIQGISAGGDLADNGAESCALLGDGTVACWGGFLEPKALMPVVVDGLTGAVSVATSGTHACALLEDGSVKCWGNNDYGQLGDGTRTSSSIPVNVADLP